MPFLSRNLSDSDSDVNDVEKQWMQIRAGNPFTWFTDNFLPVSFPNQDMLRNILLCIFSQYGISTMIEFTYMLFRQLCNSNPLRSQLNSLGQFHWERRFTSNVTYSGLFTMIYIGQIVCFETNIKNKLSDQSLTTETHFEKIIGLPHLVDVCVRYCHLFIFYAYTYFYVLHFGTMWVIMPIGYYLYQFHMTFNVFQYQDFLIIDRNLFKPSWAVSVMQLS